MSVNKYQPHVMVFPEDDANREIANGFLLEPSLNERRIQVLPVAGRWTALRDSLEREHVPLLKAYPNRVMVLLVDFDDKGEDRRANVMNVVNDESVRERVFILGAQGEPEALKAAIGSFETIGKLLARDCANNTRTTWHHQLLAHNHAEIERMVPVVKPILFCETETRQSSR